MSTHSEIASPDVRQSAITSHSIGVPELAHLLDVVPTGADLDAYHRAVVADNALALATENGREWRFRTLRRLYLLRRDAVLFRALRELWSVDESGRPLLAGLCALATDTVFRATASLIDSSSPGERVAAEQLAEAITDVYPDAYAESTLNKAASNAYTSWQQTGHLGPAQGGSKTRKRPSCEASDVAYALMLGHLEGHRGEALFETVWTKTLDHPRSHLYDLAFAASQRGMLEFRNAGGVVEVGFRQLLRPVEGELI